MHILLRTHATGETVIMDYDEFKECIRRGEILPQDEVKDRALTKDQWWTVDNLGLFHKLSPTPHPKGPHLEARERIEDENLQAGMAWSAEMARQTVLAREFFKLEERESGALVLEPYLFLSANNEEPLVDHEFAVRFTYLPSFRTPLFARVSRRADEWDLHFKRGSRPPSRRALRAREIKRLPDLVDAARLAEMPQDDGVHGFDGSTWALEVAKSGSYVFRSRWSPTTDRERGLKPFIALGKYMAWLAGKVILG